MKLNTKNTLKIYWQHTKKRRWTLAAIYVSVLGATITGTIVPLYFKKFFDNLTGSGEKSDLAVTAVSILTVIAGLELIRWIFWRTATYFNASFTPAIIANLGNTCFKYLHKHSFTYFNNSFVGTLVKRFNWFSRAFESVHDKLAWDLLPMVVNILVTTIVLGTRNIWLAVALTVWLVIFLVVNWTFTKYKMPFDVQRSEAESAATGILADTITNNSNVKLFVGYDREVAKYAEANEKVRKLRFKTWNLDGLFDAMQGFLAFVLEIGIFYGAIKLWTKNVITVGDFVLIQSYVIILFNQIWGFGKLIRYLYSDLADAEEMTLLLTTPHEIQDIKNAKELKVKSGQIIFKDVQFNYNKTREVIKKFNLEINPNEKIALVGPSGAGKTTIIKLLLRMHDLTGGSIKIDGQKINSITQETLWKNVSLVPQDPILFHRTLMENIRYGKPEATDAEVKRASELAHCHEFIDDLPDKYETYVGERGIKLSGGERQRVAIARAILRNAPILVLDEATSSLDSESESLIQSALSNLMRNKTVIVIAHRLSTIMKMDRILVINQGVIVEEGSHHELIRKPRGLYKQLWELQAGGFMQDKPADDPQTEKLKLEEKTEI